MTEYVRHPGGCLISVLCTGCQFMATRPALSGEIYLLRKVYLYDPSRREHFAILLNKCRDETVLDLNWILGAT